MEIVAGLHAKFANEQFEFSRHALDRTLLRGISTQENGLSSEAGGVDMLNTYQHEELLEQKVTYTLLKDGKFYIIENVPARVDVNTGEQYFSPQTVEHLQQTIWGRRKPVRVLQAPVYEFAA